MWLKMRRDNRLTARELKDDMDLSCAETTIRSRIRDKGAKSYFEKKKPYISKKNKKSRVAWCKAHENWTEKDWEKVVWSDESPFGLRYNAARRLYCKPDERLLPQTLKGTVKHQRKLMVWGCFTASGVGDLYKIQGIMRKEQYLDIVNQQAIPSGFELCGEGFIFQQDNDPKHTAKILKARFAELEEEGVLTLLPWPSQSPDLNPIENIWRCLNFRFRNRKCRNLDELMDELRKGWASIPTKTLKSLVHSMPRRIQAVLAAKGNSTKY